MSNKYRRIKSILVVATVFCVVIVSILTSVSFLASNTSAASGSEVMQKTLANAMQVCYSGHAVQSEINEGDVGDRGYIDLGKLVKKTESFITPTNINNSLDNSSINCQDVFVGNKKMNSIYSFFGKSNPTNLEQLGYIADSGSSNTEYQCVYLRYYLRSGNTGRYYNTNGVCMPVKNEKVVLTDAAADVRLEDNEDMATTNGAITLSLNGSAVRMTIQGSSNYQDHTADNTAIANVSDGKDFSEIISQIQSIAKNIYAVTTFEEGRGNIYATAVGGEADISVEHKAGEGGVLASSMKLDNQSSSRALKYLAGDEASFSNFEFNDSDWYYIYRTYVDRIANEGRISINSDCKPENHELSNVITYDGTNWCVVENANSVEGQFGIKKNQKSLKLGSFSEVLSAMKSLNFSQVDSDLLGGTVGGNISDTIGEDGPGSEGGESGPNCFKDSSLSWILCTAIEAVGAATNAVYDGIVSNYLEIGSNDIAANEGQGVYYGWTQFRDFANTIFVIMLIIVIFSQVTGLGLTNYGIKKVLPSLIMVAILVNLSFIICQLSVDITNILGNGFKDIFEGLSDKLPGENMTPGTAAAGLLKSLGLTGLGVGVGAAYAFSMGSFSDALGSLLVPVLAVLITVFFSIVFFFLVLAVRKAGVLILVVLSPIAVICYALPNTKNIFDKWLKLFKALLVVYPVCALLMGAGGFFGKVLLTTGSGGFFIELAAMLLQVVPFFMIPSMVRGSLALAGNIGNKIGQIGKGWGRNASNMLNHSRWAQDRQQRIMRNANLSRDTRLANRGQKLLRALEAKRDENNGVLSKRDQRRYRRAEYETARAASRYRRAVAEDAQASFDATRGLPVPGSIQYMNMMDSLKNAADAKELEEWGAALLNGHMVYEDEQGVARTIDVNNLGKLDANGKQTSTDSPETSISSAFKHYLDAYDNAEDGSDEQKIAGIKARSLATRLLEAGGDNGQTIVTNALRGRKFDANGDPLARSNTKSVDTMSEYIARNSKWMGQIKKTDTGSFAFINDAANKTANMKTRAEYHTMGDKKITAAAIPGLSDGFFEGFRQEIGALDQNGDTIFDTNNEVAQRLLDIDDAAQRALSDERISNEIKKETIDHLEALHKKAYEIRQKRWLAGSDESGAANVTQLRGYDSSGTEVSASGTDGSGYLVDNAGQRLLNAAGGAPLLAKDAYSNQINRYVKYEAGKKPASGEIKILRKHKIPYTLDPQTNQYKVENQNYINERTQWVDDIKNGTKDIRTLLAGYDTDGNVVDAYGVDAEDYLLDDKGARLLDDVNGNFLKINDAYDDQIRTSTPKFRDLTPDEQKTLDKLLDYNANIDMQNQD